MKYIIIIIAIMPSHIAYYFDKMHTILKKKMTNIILFMLWRFIGLRKDVLKICKTVS